MVNSIRKGKDGERELANELTRLGHDAMRGQQHSGRGEKDVVGLKGVHIECKRVESININKAMGQARDDSKLYEMPTVMSRKSREPWLVTMDLEDWIRLYDVWLEMMEEES